MQDEYSNFFSTELVKANTYVTALVLDDSSTLGFPGIFFICSLASDLFFNQLLKSMRFGRDQLRFTTKKDHDSFMVDGFFARA